MISTNFIEFPLDEVHQTIPSRFEKIVTLVPGRLAVSHNEWQLSYEQLNEEANRVAHALLKNSAGEPGLVVLLLDEPVNHAIAQLGVMKAGMTCVPMDAAIPAIRQAQIVEDSCARMIVTEAKHQSAAEFLLQGRGQVIVMGQLSQFSSANPAVKSDPASLAYVLFTSGSTGRPKGVMQTHPNLLHVAMLYQRDLGIGSEDRFSTPTSPAYTGTIWALLGSLTNGSAFVFTSFDSPYSFLESLNRERVTVAQLIVTLFRQFLLAFEEPLEIPSLRLVYTGGEALQKDDVAKFARLFPKKCRLLYNFGSTEAGMITHHQFDRENLKEGMEAHAVPVGFPVEDTVVMLLDEKGEAFLPQDEGEITVSSQFLSSGYWRDEELTRSRFQEGGKYGRIYFTGDFGRMNPDGRLIHLGRKDNQVKVRGYRINFEEIEQALRSIEEIAAAAVLIQTDQQGKNRIVAYLERTESRLTVTDIRNHLTSLLPPYMIPALIFNIDRLPVAPNGKLNRKLLAGFNISRPELNTTFTLPETDTERFLCTILSEILSVEPVGSKDNLFELGADSISIFHLVGRIQSSLHVEINPAFVFSSPVIADLARKLDGVTRTDVR